jgi:hypothetical protein
MTKAQKSKKDSAPTPQDRVDKQEKADAKEDDFDLLKLVPSFNHNEGKLLFKVVEDTWAPSLFSAIVSTILILGGIHVAIFVAFGINSNRGIHWAIKEYSDNVADVCSIVTIAFFAYVYSMTDHGLTLGLEFVAAADRTRDPKMLERISADIRKKVSRKPNFIIYATLRLLVAVVPIAAAAYFFVGGSHSFQELLQNYFDEVCCVVLPHATLK